MSGNGRKRGRPPKIIPFFADPEAERRRVEKCHAEGRDPHPAFERKQCEAEQDLRKDIMPGVPFNLVLQLNDSDDYGGPTSNPEATKKFEDAAAERSKAASRGGELRPCTNLAREVVYEEYEYIKTSRANGMTDNAIRLEIDRRRKLKGKPCAGRSQMYEALKRL